ncbi:MAG: hypothetical protein AAFX99_22035, partial [Myxococcota bacterium]
VEAHDNISVYSGRFGVNIGSETGSGIHDCIFDSQQVFVSIGVRNAEEEEEAEYASLAGRQRIRPVPFSYWSAEGSDFKVDGDLGVEGQILFDNAHDSDGNLGEFSDYKLLLWSSDTTANSYGFGIQSGTLFANSANEFDFKIQGTDRLNLTNTNATLNTNLDVRGRLYNGGGDMQLDDVVHATGPFDFESYLYNDSGDVTINDNLDISGDIQDYNSTEVTIRDGLNVTNNVTVGSDGSGNLTVNSNATISGNTTIGGTLTVNNQSLDNYIRSWIRSNCQVSIGFRENANSSHNPSIQAVANANGTCNSSSQVCTDNNTWSAMDPSGQNLSDDYFYVRFVCD